MISTTRPVVRSTITSTFGSTRQKMPRLAIEIEKHAGLLRNSRIVQAAHTLEYISRIQKFSRKNCLDARVTKRRMYIAFHAGVDRPGSDVF